MMNWLSNRKKSSVINDIIKDFESITTEKDMTELLNVIKKYIDQRKEKIKSSDKLYLNINNDDECNIKMEFILNDNVIGYTDNSGKITMFEISQDFLKWKNNENRKSSSELIIFRDTNYFINSHGVLSNEKRYNNQIFDFVEGTSFSNVGDVNFVIDNDKKIPVIHLIK